LCKCLSIFAKDNSPITAERVASGIFLTILLSIMRLRFGFVLLQFILCSMLLAQESLHSLPLEYYQQKGLIPARLGPWQKTGFPQSSQLSEASHEYILSSSGDYLIDLTGQTRVVNSRITIANVGTSNIVNPWVTANGRGNWFSATTIANEAVGDETDPALRGFRIWRLLRDNIYHWYPAESGAEIHSPVKFLNIYGYGFCDDSATNTWAISERVGLPGREWWIMGHVVSEIQYGGSWHMFDADLKVFYPKADNLTVASVSELEENGGLVERISSPAIAELYTTTRDNSVRKQSAQLNYTMAMTLRPGERLERCFYNWGKFHDTYKHREPPVYGNGRQVYHPDLSDDVFMSGFTNLVNVEAFFHSGATPNIHLKQASETAELVCQLNSAYVLVGGSVKLDAYACDANDQLEVWASRSNGTWNLLGSISGPFAGPVEYSLDSLILPVASAACYDLSFRITMVGTEKTSVGVNELELIGEIQCAPASLPKLSAGSVNPVKVCFDGDAWASVSVVYEYEQDDEAVFPTAPSAPITPMDDEQVDTDTPELSWHSTIMASELAEREILVSWDSEGFHPVSPILFTKVSDATWNVPANWLLDGNSYYWRVRESVQSGDWSSWSNPWQFSVLYGSGSITPTPTPTSTNTATCTLMPTPMDTLMPTETYTPTPTLTNTPTYTPTPTPTNTLTYTPTPTLTNTLTYTPTPTPTDTPTYTPTPTSTVTPFNPFDLDQDGYIRSSDMLILSNALITGTTDGGADLNDDGCIDHMDLLIFSFHWCEISNAPILTPTSGK
jgi:Dockerin type I domain